MSADLEPRTLSAGSGVATAGTAPGRTSAPRRSLRGVARVPAGRSRNGSASGTLAAMSPSTHHGPEQWIVVAGESESSGRVRDRPLCISPSPPQEMVRGDVPDAHVHRMLQLDDRSGACRASDPGATWRSHRTEASRESIHPAEAEQRAFGRRSSVCRLRLRAISPRRRCARHLQGDPPHTRVALPASVPS